MNRPQSSAEDEITAIVAGAARQPLLDAAFELWRRRYRLDTIEGRPTADEIRINRSLTPEQWRAKYQHERDHAHEGPMFGYLKRAHPQADDDAIRQASSLRSSSTTPAPGTSTGTVISGSVSCARWHSGTGISRLSRDHLSRRPQQSRLLHEMS